MAAPTNPKGAKSDKIWRDAVMRAVRRLDSDPVETEGPPAQRLERLADALVAKGLGGDVPAIKEIGDRLDGKAHQSIELEGDVQHSYVARIPGLSPDMDTWQKQHGDKLKSSTLQ